VLIAVQLESDSVAAILTCALRCPKAFYSRSFVSIRG
jgi:hypothetical protein